MKNPTEVGSFQNWWRRGESNPRPKNLDRRCLRVQLTVGSRQLAGCELPTRPASLADLDYGCEAQSKSSLLCGVMIWFTGGSR